MRLWLWKNPVLLKELRIGLRERRLLILQGLYLLLLLALTLMVMPEMFRHPSSEHLAEQGRQFFDMLFWVQLLLLVFLMPALTCGSLSGERERHSLEMLLASRLGSGQLVLGKLGFALYVLVLLIFSALPLASIAFFLGGVTLGKALESYFELAVFGALAACVGLFASAREKRSNYATVQAYLAVLVGSMGLPFYAYLRYEDDFRLNFSWGEVGPLHYLSGVALYAFTVSFLKARHRVRPEARNVKALGLSFGLFYLYSALWFWVTLKQWMVTSSQGQNQVSHLLCAYYWVAICSAGFFLNPPNLESARQRAQLPRHLSLWWWFFFLAILGLPVWLTQGQADLARATWWAAQLALIWLVLFPLVCRAWQKAWLVRWQFAWIYYLGLLLFHFLPALGSFSPSGSLARLTYASPWLSLLELYEGPGSFYLLRSTGLLLLAFGGLALPGWWMRRRAV